MKVLFSVQYGSRLYGTNTPTSDLDYKHLVLPSLDDLLVGKRVKNEVAKTNNEKNTRNGADDVDNEYIPLQVFAHDFLGGQTYALELAFAVDYIEAYQVVFDGRLVDFCHELRNRFLTSNMAALVGYAVNQASLYSFKGERLNTVREVKAILEVLGKRFGLDTKISEVDTIFALSTESIAAEHPKYFQLTTYQADAVGTMKPCAKLLEKVLPFSSTLRVTLKTVDAQLNKYGSRADAASIDNVDWKATAHALRVVDEGISLLKTHSLRFPFEKSYIDFFLSIKRGEIPYNEVIDMINSRLDTLKTMEAESTLPKKTPELTEELNVWLAKWMRIFYGLSS